MTDGETRKQLRRLARRVEALEDVVRESDLGSLLRRLDALTAQVKGLDRDLRAMGKRLKAAEGQIQLAESRIDELDAEACDLADSNADPLVAEDVRKTTIDRILTENAFLEALEAAVGQAVEVEVALAFHDWEAQSKIDEHLVRLAGQRAISRARLGKANLTHEARESLLEQAISIGAYSEDEAVAYREQHGLHPPRLRAVDEAS